MILNDLDKLVNELNTTNSSNDKKKILEKYPQCKDILSFVYSPFTQFNVSSDNLKKKSALVEENDLDIISLLTKLNDRTFTGHKAISVINGFIKKNNHADLVYMIIDKNLKVRLDAKLINKVFNDCVPQFEVALANNYDHRADKIDFERDEFYASRKLDGCRVLAIVENKKISFFSRQGKEFFTLDNLKSDIEDLNLDNVVFDGEVCMVDKNGKEDFASIIKLIRRKDFTIENPKYKIFDMITLKDFYQCKSKTILRDRFDHLNTFFKNSKHCEIIEQWRVKSNEHLVELQNLAEKSGWEGLILRKNTIYEGKRSNNMLKVKKFHDAEYVVNNVVMGPIRFIKDGLEVEEEMLSAVVISHKGFTVKVGSGFTLDQRKQFKLAPDQIIGKTITVKYFEESTDQNGNLSLRFPVLKHIYEGNREV